MITTTATARRLTDKLNIKESLTDQRINEGRDFYQKDCGMRLVDRAVLQ